MRGLVLALVGGIACAGLTTAASAEMDRYGGAPGPAPVQRTAAQASAPRAEGPAAMRVLTWTGKSASPAAPAPLAYAPQPRETPAPVAAAMQPTARFAPQPASYRAPAADDGFVPLYPQGAPAAAAPAPQPTSIYAPPAPQAPPPIASVAQPAPAARQQQVASAAPRNPNGPRTYSVHREFGMTPDPIPIAPQFFGATADLSTPPADTGRERRIITGSDGKTTTVMRNSTSASDE